MPSAFRSRDCTLRSRRASSTGDAIWPRHRSDITILAVGGLVDTRLSRGRAKPTLSDALSNAREIGHAATLMYALTHVSMTHFFLWNYATASAEADELVDFGGRKRQHRCGRLRNDAPRLSCCPDRQSLGRSSNDNVRQLTTCPVSRINIVDAFERITFGESLCRTRPIR